MKLSRQALAYSDSPNRNGSGSTKALAQTYCFADPLFPDRIWLLLDLSARTAVLLRLGEGESVSLLRSRQLTPSGAKVFLALLQAYPQHCEFARLFASLDLPQPEKETMYGEKHGADWEIAVRPVRRAIATLAPMLAAFGLQLLSLRNRGYLLALDAKALLALASEQPIPAGSKGPPSSGALTRTERLE